MKEVYSKMKTESLSSTNSFKEIDTDCKLHLQFLSRISYLAKQLPL